MMFYVGRCRKFIVVSRPFHSSRSPSSADDEGVKLMSESGTAVGDAGKTMYVIERGERSYG